VIDPYPEFGDDPIISCHLSCCVFALDLADQFDIAPTATYVTERMALLPGPAHLTQRWINPVKSKSDFRRRHDRLR